MNSKITDEQMAAYLDGNLYGAEFDRVYEAISSDSQSAEVASVMADVNFATSDPFDQIPDFGLVNFGGDMADMLIDYSHNTPHTVEYTNPIQQQYSDTCAIKSQQLILNDFGISVTEDQLVQYSYEQGWYQGDGSGTSMEDVGKLLSDAGIPCTQTQNANVFNLVNELAQGHKIIVGVDSGELWGNRFIEWLKDFFLGETPDHAIIVAGIDTSDVDDIKVLVTDPGTGEHKTYPLSQFMDAWSDSSCFMVSTDISVPTKVAGMENFDPIAGHIPDVAGMSYENFQIFNDISMGVPNWVDPQVFPNIGFEHVQFPMTSLVDAYFDVAQNTIPFNQIFTGYDFNNYLDVNAVASAMQTTFSYNNAYISSFPEYSWDFYANTNGLVDMTNIGYADYLTQSFNYFDANGGMLPSMFDQQMMMMDFCNANNLIFYDTFYI